MAVVPFSTLMLLNRPQQGLRPIAEAVFAGLLTAATALYRVQRRRATTGSRSGPARCICCWRLRCGRRGPRKSQNKQADRETRQADIVEHDPESGGDQPAGEQHDRRPDQVQCRDDQRDAAEYRIA